MSEWSAHNNTIATNQIRIYLAEIKQKIVAKLRDVAKLMVSWIDGKFSPVPPYEPGGNDEFPVWLGHLADATGVGLYIDGRTEYFMPTKVEIGYQTSSNMKGTKIYGNSFLFQAITNTATQFAKGIWIVLFSAVPYAMEINLYGSVAGRGMGFFDKSVQELTVMLLSNITPLAK